MAIDKGNADVMNPTIRSKIIFIEKIFKISCK